MGLVELSFFILHNSFVLFVASQVLWIYVLTVLVFTYFLCKDFGPIRNEFRSIHYLAWISLALIILLGLYIRAANYEQYSYIDSELGEYVNQAVYLHEGKSLEISFHGKFYSFFLYILFVLFGFKIGVVGWYNAVVGALTIGIVFLLAYAIFRNEKGALIASLFFAASPGPILYSIRNGDATTGLFLGSLTFLFLFLYMRNQQASLLILCLTSLMAALLTRVNYILLIPAIVFVCYLHRKKIQNYPKKWIVISLLALIIALTPVAYTLSTNISYMQLPVQLEKIATSGPSFARMEHVQSMMNILFATEPADPRFWQVPRWSYAFVILSGIWFWRFQKEILVLLIYLATMLAIYANSIVHLTPIDLPRMMIPWIIVHSILVGMGFAVALGFLKRLPRYGYLAGMLVLFVLISYLVLHPVSEKIFDAAHRNDKTGMDMIQACWAIPSGSYLIFQNSLYNSLYFHCYDHLDGKIHNQLPHSIILKDLKEGQSILSLKEQGLRVFVAAKPGLREPEWEAFQRFITATDHALYWESGYIDLYEIIGE